MTTCDDGRCYSDCYKPASCGSSGRVFVLVGRGGVEPPTFRFSGPGWVVQDSPLVAGVQVNAV
jgi:hypothetical protein